MGSCYSILNFLLLVNQRHYTKLLLIGETKWLGCSHSTLKFYECPHSPSLSRPEKRFHLSIAWWPRTARTAASRTRVTAEQTRTHPEVFLDNKTFLSEKKDWNSQCGVEQLNAREKRGGKIIIWHYTNLEGWCHQEIEPVSRWNGRSWMVVCLLHA